MVTQRREVDQPSVCGSEAARVKVEGRQVKLEVEVEPFTAGRFGVPRCLSDDLGPNSPTLPAAACLGVDQRGVVAAIPGDVDKPDEYALVVAGRDPSQAVRIDPVPPPDTPWLPWDSTNSTIWSSVIGSRQE